MFQKGNMEVLAWDQSSKGYWHFWLTARQCLSMSSKNRSGVRTGKKWGPIAPEQVNCAFRQVKKGVLWSGMQVKLGMVVLLVDMPWTLHAYWASNVVGATKNWNLLAQWATGVHFFHGLIDWQRRYVYDINLKENTTTIQFFYPDFLFYNQKNTTLGASLC